MLKALWLFLCTQFFIRSVSQRDSLTGASASLTLIGVLLLISRAVIRHYRSGRMAEPLTKKAIELLTKFHVWR